MGANGLSFIYAVHSGQQGQPVGTLDHFIDRGRADGRVQWDGPRTVGEGWDDSIGVFPGRGGIIYTIKPNGDLLRFVHLGVSDGSVRWVEPDRNNPLGRGFGNFLHVFGGLNDVIYAVTKDGTLLWFKDHPDNGGQVLDGPKTVGSGFNAPFAIVPGDGNVIYTIEDGSLVSRQHFGNPDGTDSWSGKTVVSTQVPLSGNQVVRWDQFQRVFAPSPLPSGNFTEIVEVSGFIYMITDDGDLIRIRQFGVDRPSKDFSTPVNLGRAPGPPTHPWPGFLRVFAARLSA
jgi:hypothetical protein